MVQLCACVCVRKRVCIAFVDQTLICFSQRRALLKSFLFSVTFDLTEGYLTEQADLPQLIIFISSPTFGCCRIVG